MLLNFYFSPNDMFIGGGFLVEARTLGVFGSFDLGFTREKYQSRTNRTQVFPLLARALGYLSKDARPMRPFRLSISGGLNYDVLICTCVGASRRATRRRVVPPLETLGAALNT